MRRRLLSLCLMLCMVLGMLPVMATAAEAACLTVKAGEAEYEASCVDAGSVYAVQIPEVTAVTIGKTDAAAGDYTAANVSGGLLVSFQEYLTYFRRSAPLFSNYAPLFSTFLHIPSL